MNMSDNNVISLRAYQKKCTRWGNQILMFPGSVNGSTKWQALEVQTKESHKCIIANTITKTDEKTLEKTVENSSPVIRHTNEDEIIALKARVLALENWVKRMNESAMMNL